MFMDEVRQFQIKAEQRARDIHNGIADLAYSSIVEGSPVTGAPGQPVDTGNLKASWQNTVEGPLTRLLSTNVIYAPIIEDGSRAGRALTLRSKVGGFHSVKLTIAAWPRIVEWVTKGLSNA